MDKAQIEKKIKYYQRRRKNIQRKMKEYREGLEELGLDREDEWIIRKEDK